MSKKVDMITISPERDCREEGFRITGYECPNCHGMGHVQNGLDFENPYIECGFCNGSGKVTAEVSIFWRSENK